MCCYPELGKDFGLCELVEFYLIFSDWRSVLFLFFSSNLSLVLLWTVFLRGLMLFYVLGGVEQCYLFVLCIVKWTVSMISWKVALLEGCGCVSSWHSRNCCPCCVDSSVSRSYLSLLVKPICLAAFQNKHLVFGVGRLVFVGPTLCKIRARIYDARMSLIWNTTKRYCWCCEVFPNEDSSSRS